MLQTLYQAALTEQAWKAMVADMSGYQAKTTFYSDFTIAELCGGEKAVRDTYKRAFNEWKHNVEYFTEFVMVLNHKAWEMHGKGDDELGIVYSQLWEEAQNWGYDNFKGEDLTYFWSTLD